MPWRFVRSARAVATCALVLAACALGACGRDDRAPAKPRELADELYALAGTPEATRVATVRAWRLDRAAWDAVVVAPYRELYADYARAFDAAVPALVTQLATKRPILARAHFAEDPRLTRAQAITRWALPTLASARVVELGGAPPVAIDAVFVEAGGRWRAIVGLDAIVHARIAAHDPACADVLTRIEHRGPCIEAVWAVADAALRGDRARVPRTCTRALGLCAKPTR